MTTEELTKKAKKTIEHGLDKLAKGHPEHEEIDAHSEGPLARTIEYQTARIPSDVFLWGALAAGGAALALRMTGRKSWAATVAQIAPALLTMGVYNKIVKVAGSDRLDQGRPIFARGGREATLH